MELKELLEALEGVEQKLASANAEAREDLVAQVKSLNDKIEALEAKAAEVPEGENAPVTKADLEDLEAKMRAPGFISQTSATERRKELDAFNEFLRKGEHDMLEHKSTDLQASTDASGGFSVPEELRQQIIQIEHEISPMRQVADVRSSSTSDVKQLVGHGAAASGWVGETTARTQTDTPDLAQRTAVFGEVYAMPRAYQHVLEDSFFDIEAWLSGEVARQFAEVSGVAFLSGDGTNKPKGILDGLTAGANAAVNDATGAFQVINSGVSGALAATDVAQAEFIRQSVIPALKTGYLPGAQFMMNKNTYAEIATWKDANNQFYLNPNIANPAEQRLFGYSIVINDDMAGLGAGAAFPIIFGDFSRAYQIIDRTGVSVLRDPYTNKGSVLYYTRKRVGSMILDANAIKVVSVSA